jgi:hypothetical protein
MPPHLRVFSQGIVAKCPFPEKHDPNNIVLTATR